MSDPGTDVAGRDVIAERDAASGGVIWITGYSSAGKTSIGRRVEAEIRGSGATAIFLDGDDLRGVLGGRGYSDDERRELARVYLRLCSHIASQGAVVVIEVSDTGPGFPAKAREHLFEAFQGSTRSGGTGLASSGSAAVS